jgi:ribosomal protein S18 acetylase RimI-like enzyme
MTSRKFGVRPTIEFGLARVEDAPTILELQRLAYQSEAALYNDVQIPPLRQTLPELELELRHKTFLKATASQALIGSVRASLQNEMVLIERLIVHPDVQRQGIGSRLIQEIENHFLEAQRFALFTGHNSIGNLRLYERLGFVRHHEEIISASLRLIHLEKRRLP